jgi:tetratricopeptide (TPR) repeat protein
MPGSNESRTLPRGLLVTVAALAVMVLGLGGAVIVLQLLPEDAPQTAAERSIRVWEQAVEDNPGQAWPYTGLGEAYLSDGRLEDAEEAFTEAVLIDQDQWDAWMRLGLMLVETDPTTAEQYLTEATRAAPRTAKAVPYAALGDFHLARGNLDEARAAYESAIADSPFVIEGHLGLAQTLEALGDIEGAITQYERAADFDPTNPIAGEGLERLGAAGDPSQ